MSTTTVETTTSETFTEPNPFLGETSTLLVNGRALPAQRVLNGIAVEVPTQRSHS